MPRATALLIAMSVLPFAASPARAGELTGSSDCRGGCTWQLAYQSLPSDANRITVSSLAEGRVRFTDSATTVHLGGEEGLCAGRSPHTFICGRAGESFTSIQITGGDRGDVIDARRLRGAAYIEGGKGDDRLYAPNWPESGELVGGGGHNLLVGVRSTVANYRATTGSLTVDLAAGIATAPGLRDRIIGVGQVYGGRGTNHLFGGRTPGERLEGGTGRNYLVSRSPGTELVAEGPRNTLVCTPDTRVMGLRMRDIALGPCRTGNPALQMLLPLRRLSGGVVELPGNAQQYTEINLRVLPSGASVGHLGVGARTAPNASCALSAYGQALLRRRRHIEVQVEGVQPGPSWRPGPVLDVTFKTIIRAPEP